MELSTSDICSNTCATGFLEVIKFEQKSAQLWKSVSEITIWCLMGLKEKSLTAVTEFEDAHLKFYKAWLFFQDIHGDPGEEFFTFYKQKVQGIRNCYESIFDDTVNLNIREIELKDPKTVKTPLSTFSPKAKHYCEGLTPYPFKSASRRQRKKK